jgi:5-(aminomethyl)-3-furanmethanol phosphate kinase
LSALAAPQPLTIIKLGGSHALGPHLGPWIEAIAAQAGAVVVVPGGGPFADAVRAAQGPMGFDDVAAHHMALMAMAQFGRALASLNPLLATATSRTAINRLLLQRRVPIWAPERMALAAGLPASWELTSDSLAAWLAGEIGAQRLVLVKHGSFRAFEDASDLARREIVDALFPKYLAHRHVRATLAGPLDHARLADELLRPALPQIAQDSTHRANRLDSVA